MIFDIPLQFPFLNLLDDLNFRKYNNSDFNDFLQKSIYY